MRSLFLILAASVFLFGCIGGDEFKDMTNYKQGMQALKNNDLVKAEDLLNKAVKEEPNNENIYFSLGVIQGLKGDKLKEREFLQQSIAVNPTFEAGYYYLAVNYMEAKEIQPAIENLKKSIELNPLNESAYLALGDIYAEHSGPKTALTYYKKAAELNSEEAKQKAAAIESKFPEKAQ